MKNYLALIRKADFNDLYRYGFLRISEHSSVEFTCSPDNLTSNPEMFIELTKNANEFDYAFEYLLIHYELADDAPKTSINIEEVKHIYPLDHDSQRELATSFDERIQICQPIWNDAVIDLQKYWAVRSCIKGAQNIWQIFKIQYPIESIQKVVTIDIVKQLVHLVYSGQAPHGDIPLLIYLLRYERHAFYSKGTIGYFLDALHAYCNYYIKSETDSIESANAYKILSKFRDNEKFKNIIKGCYENKKNAAINTYLDTLRNICPEFSYFEVAPLFLALRNYWSEGLTDDYMNVYKACSSYTSEENYAIVMYMLGVVLGHEKTYDALYEALHLAIFKPKQIVAPKPEPAKKTTLKSAKTLKKSKTSSKMVVEDVPMDVEVPHVEPMATEAQESITIPSKMNELAKEEEVIQRDLFGEPDKPTEPAKKKKSSRPQKAK